MKQHITEKQYNELSPKQKKIWHKWAVKRGYTMQKVYKHYYYKYDKREFGKEMLLGFPSIGEMIEFLVEKQLKLYRDIHIEMLHNRWQISTCYDEKWVFEEDAEKGELCDALWYACKEVLEK